MYPSLFDLHCDTATALFKSRQSLKDNDLHISLEKASVFRSYRQVLAIWSDNALDDETAFQRFLAISKFLHGELAQKELGFPLLTSGRRLPERGALLSVEDARILGGSRDRLAVLYAHGVRLLTLVWHGESCIGGAHNTKAGLTPFGKQVVKDCFTFGIVPDISHASTGTAEDIFALAEAHKKPVIASHSNAFSVCSHSRNLSDRQFLKIKELGGIVGLCLCPAHLSDDPKKADVEKILEHIEHFYALGGEDTLALGCDLDGTELPGGFSSIADLVLIAEEMAKHGYSDRQIEKLFSLNAENFVRKNI